MDTNHHYGAKNALSALHDLEKMLNAHPCITRRSLGDKSQVTTTNILRTLVSELSVLGTMTHRTTDAAYYKLCHKVKCEWRDFDIHFRQPECGNIGFDKDRREAAESEEYKAMEEAMDDFTDSHTKYCRFYSFRKTDRIFEGLVYRLVLTTRAHLLKVAKLLADSNSNYRDSGLRSLSCAIESVTIIDALVTADKLREDQNFSAFINNFQYLEKAVGDLDVDWPFDGSDYGAVYEHVQALSDYIDYVDVAPVRD